MTQRLTIIPHETPVIIQPCVVVVDGGGGDGGGMNISRIHYTRILFQTGVMLSTLNSTPNTIYIYTSLLM